jgi:hypothetical protein
MDGDCVIPFLVPSITLGELREDEAVFSSIKTLRQYDRLVRCAFTDVSQSYAKQGILFPSLADFRSAHTQIFASVSADAGRMRDENCMVQIFGKFVDDCDLEGEFKLLAKQLAEMVADARTVQDRVVIVAFTHAWIVAAQPALFGNKRTAMCLALSQVKALFRTIAILNPLDIPTYYAALDAKINGGRYGLLNEVFGQILDIAGPFTPFSARCHDDLLRWKQSQEALVKSSHLLVTVQ